MHTLPPSPRWRMLLTSWDIVIHGGEHNWVNMSVLCVLSDMTPGCSSGARNTLIEGFILQSHCIVHYRDAFFCMFYEHNQLAGNKLSVHLDSQVSVWSFSVPSVSALGYQGPVVYGLTCELRQWFVHTGKHDLEQLCKWLNNDFETDTTRQSGWRERKKWKKLWQCW